ncbi:type IX secretion system membrane protein PorP/SprF [Fluviicola sp.]|uniref:type IX secretion system membrane protein PorP/SprF n=1 Tax=Fluviicola sp. TaxID=1917219 RepID=UPI00262E61AE|nr:type IX secretion system membrane protein PorP/SprF [Fluviicola sp.]
MKNVYTLAFILTALSSVIHAQNNLRPNMYFQKMHYYNVAAGIEDSSAHASFDLYAKYKILPESNDVWKKPVNIYFNHIYNLNQKNAFHMSYIYDGYSYYNRNSVYLGYTRMFRWGKSSRLNLGARAILNFNQFDWAGFAGPVTSTPKLKFNADLDFGVQYQWKGLTVGASAKNLFASSAKISGVNFIKDHREIYGNLSYNFGLFKHKIELAPFLLAYAERDFDLDAGLNLNLFKVVSVSYAIRVLELRSIYSIRGNFLKRNQVCVSLEQTAINSDMKDDLLLGYRF